MKLIGSSCSPLDWFSKDDSYKHVRAALRNLSGRAAICLTDSQFKALLTASDAEYQWLQALWEFLEAQGSIRIEEEDVFNCEIIISESGVEELLDIIAPLAPTDDVGSSRLVKELDESWIEFLGRFSQSVVVADRFAFVNLANQTRKSHSGCMQFLKRIASFESIKQLEIISTNPLAQDGLNEFRGQCTNNCRTSSKPCEDCRKFALELFMGVDELLPPQLRISFVPANIHHRTIVFEYRSNQPGGDTRLVEIVLGVSKGLEAFQCKSRRHETTAECSDHSPDPRIEVLIPAEANRTLNELSDEKVLSIRWDAEEDFK